MGCDTEDRKELDHKSTRFAREALATPIQVLT
jgi:hypothetical protein